MRFLDVTLDTYQDTSGYMYLGLFITIHRDTKSRYMYLGRVMTTLQDTIRIHHHLHVSWTLRPSRAGYTHGIRVSGAGMGS